MKRILALILAAAMLLAGNVVALAAETTGGETGDTTAGTTTPDTTTPEDGATPPDDTTNPDTPVEEAAPVTLNDYQPGEQIQLSWNIHALGNTQGIRVLTTDGVKLVKYSHDNEAELDFFDEVENDSMVWLKIKLKNNNAETVNLDKPIEDTIYVTLDNGKTYSFPLLISYNKGAKLEVKSGDRNHFILGKESSFVMTMLDPENVFPLPYEVEIVQQSVSGTELSEDEQLLRIKDIQKDGKDFTVSVEAIRVGRGHMNIYVTDGDGRGYGQGQSMEVSADGTYKKPETLQDRNDRSDNQRAEESAMDALESVNEAIASGETMPAKAQTVTTATGESTTVVSAKLYGLGASLSVDTMATLAGSKVGLRANLDNGAAEVVIPGGFTMPTGTGVLGYSLGFQKEPLYTNLMTADVAAKNPDAKTEVYKVGGGVLPTTATVTIKTKIAGKVNVYYWNEATRRYTLIASPTAENGKVTFATKQLGSLVVTTGTI